MSLKDLYQTRAKRFFVDYFYDVKNKKTKVFYFYYDKDVDILGNQREVIQYLQLLSELGFIESKMKNIFHFYEVTERGELFLLMEIL